MRRVLAALCLLATGCTASSPIGSAVDMTPMYARSFEAPIPAGLYCPVTVSWRADGEIVGVAPGPRSSCLTYSWDGMRRVIVGLPLAPSDEEGPHRIEIALAPLGVGLFIAQTANTGGSAEAQAAVPYVVATLLAAGGVYSLTPALDEGMVGRIFARFPQIAYVPFETEDGPRYVKSGAREDIAAALKETATLSLSLPDENGNMTLALLVRADAPAAEPVSSLLKRLDLAAIRAAAVRLARQAPSGIVAEDPS